MNSKHFTRRFVAAVFRLQTRLMLVLLLSIAILITFLVTNHQTYNRDIKVINQERLTERESAFDEVIKAKGAGFDGFVLDYTFWDDMVTFVQGDTIDPDFAHNVIDSSLESFGANAIWIFDASGEPYYQTTNIAAAGDDPIVTISANQLVSLFGRDHSLQRRYQPTKYGTLELVMASVHPGDDQDRKTAPRGYFIAARVIDDTYLNDLSKQAISTVELIDHNKSQDYPTTFDLATGKLAFKRELTTLDGSAGKDFYITSVSTGAQIFAKTYSQLALYETIGFTIMVIAVFAAVRYWVNVPLRSLMRALETKDTVLAQKIATQRDEFGQVGQLLADSFRLSKQLEEAKLNTEYKVALRTQELRETQARLHASIDSLQNGFLITDYNGHATLSNPALHTILRLPKGGEMQLTSVIATRLAGSFDFLTAIRQCLGTGDPFTVSELELDQKYYIRLFGSAVRLDSRDSAIIGCVILAEDITESRRLERSKEEFISIASHELRTPLSAIRGNAAILEELIDDHEDLAVPDNRRIISDIKGATIRLIDIVNQFLSMSRLEQGKTVHMLEPIHMPEVVQQVIQSLSILAEKKQLSLVADLPANLPYAKGDRTQTVEVITNLIGNAIKYTDVGRIIVTASADDSQVKITVSDTGKGIDPKNRDLLFRKFHQASSDLLVRDDSRSTGLGLYISKLLVEQMGGTIQLEASDANQGSTFSFTLPIAKPLKNQDTISTH